MDRFKGVLTCLLLMSLLTKAIPAVPSYRHSSNETSFMTEAPPVVMEPMCSDKFGSLPISTFSIRVSVMCYMYMFGRKGKELTFGGFFSLRYINQTRRAGPVELSPDGKNETVMSLVCATLNEDECERWRACTAAGARCCQEMTEMPPEVPAGYCPRTWDGYSCWPDTPAGKSERGPCPSFMEHAITTRSSVKKCTVNATWFRLDGNPWTNYAVCVDMDAHMKAVYIGLACSVVSLSLLIPATIIFLCYRDLLRQHRVRLHINFFLSLILSGISEILWFILVHHDVFTNSATTQRVMYKNPVWCRILSFFKVYLRCTNYFWMMCEGFFLHRLISNAFEQPKSLVYLYIVGWGMPAVPGIVWSIVRGISANEDCWSKHYGSVMYLIWVPNLLCLVLNTIFLCNILRILLCQLHSHPHEPSNFRRALKAAFMLVPLFGLQTILTMYRPPDGAPGSTEYEYLNVFFTHSQGIFVSLIFCFFNGEVVNHLGSTFPCLRRCSRRRRNQGYTSHTQVTTADQSPSLSLRSSIRNSPHISRLVNGETELNGERTRTDSNGSVNAKGQRLSSKKGEYTSVPT